MQEIEPKTIGRRLRQIRESLNLKQEEFSKRVGLTQSAICQYERGDRIPSGRALQQISARLRLPLAELLRVPDQGPEEQTEKELLINMIANKLRLLPKDQILHMDRSIDFMVRPKEKP